MPRAWLRWNLLYAALLGVTAAQAQEQPADDAEFLEYLASWDSEDEGWNDYLASTDVRKQDGSKDKAVPGTGDETQDKTESPAGGKPKAGEKTTKVDEHEDK